MKYWNDDSIIRTYNIGVKLETRAEIAYHLIGNYGAIAGRNGEPDKDGRPTLVLQTPEELVERCFKIADLFIEMAEKRGELLPAPTMSDEERFARMGHLEGIKAIAAYDKDEIAKFMDSFRPSGKSKKE